MNAEDSLTILCLLVIAAGVGWLIYAGGPPRSPGDDADWPPRY